MNLRERLLRIADKRYLERGLPIPADLGARLMAEGVIVSLL